MVMILVKEKKNHLNLIITTIVLGTFYIFMKFNPTTNIIHISVKLGRVPNYGGLCV